MTAYPIRDVARPAVLDGKTNGLLPPSALVVTSGAGPVVTLCAPATLAWRALVAAAQADGHTLAVTSTADSYRPYSVQESTFRARYTTTLLPGRPYKTWHGGRWYQRPGTAQAAVPGTSNHGWALAVDVANVDSHLTWLLAHAFLYGWSWETVDEPWHLHYYPGDAIPAAVLAHEEDTMALRDDPDGLALIKRVEALYLGAATVTYAPGGKTRTETNGVAAGLGKLSTVDPADVAKALAGNAAFVAALATAIAAKMGTHTHQVEPVMSGPQVPIP